MKAEKISVIIPLYNARPFIEQTIQSILAQTIQDFHLYIIDDLSSDGSAEIVTKLAEKNKDKITYQRLTKKAGKPSIGKNVGIRISKGQYIAFMDHDDWWENNHLELLIGRMEESPKAGVVGTNGYFYDNDRKQVLGTYRPINEKLTPGQLRLLTLTQPPYLTSSCIMVRRSVVSELGPIDESLGMSDDHELYMRVAFSKNFELLSLSQPTVYRRWVKQSFSNSDQAMELIVKDNEMLFKRFSPQVSKPEEKELLTNWYWQFQKRWANYLVTKKRYAEAQKIYRQVIAHTHPGKELKIFYPLVITVPALARQIALAKRRWSFTHPDIALVK